MGIWVLVVTIFALTYDAAVNIRVVFIRGEVSLENMSVSDLNGGGVNQKGLEAPQHRNFLSAAHPARAGRSHLLWKALEDGRVKAPLPLPGLQITVPGEGTMLNLAVKLPPEATTPSAYVALATASHRAMRNLRDLRTRHSAICLEGGRTGAFASSPKAGSEGSAFSNLSG